MFAIANIAVVETLATVAATLNEPALPFAVNVGEVATPDASVATVVLDEPANIPLAPEPGGALNVTTTPGTGLPPESCTVTTNGPAKAVLTLALWPPPAVAVILADAPAVFVSGKLVGVPTPATVATTAYDPAALLAVIFGEVATPKALVTAVAMTEPAKLPLAPDAGAVNVTVTPEAGLPPESDTVAASGLAKVVLIVPL